MSRPLRLAPKPAPDAVADVLRGLALALAPHLVELLGAARVEAELVDVAAVVPLSRRVVYSACRRGDVAGAARVGRRWLATRAAVDAWLCSCGPRVVASPADDEDELEATRRRLAAPGRRRRSA
jgi:hypothetical protein